MGTRRAPMTASTTSTATPAPTRQLETVQLETVTAIRIARGCAQLVPHLAVRTPLGILQAGDLQLCDVEGAMAVRAYVLDARPSQQKHAAPRARLDRHAQTPQTDPAAVALVPDTNVQKTAGQQEPQPRHERVKQIVSEARRSVIVELGRPRPEM